MVTLLLWGIMLAGEVYASDHCQARYDMAYYAFMSRQPDAPTRHEDNRIVREANSPTHGQPHISETGKKLAAEAFARREYQECKRDER